MGYVLSVTLEVALSESAPRVLRYCVGYLGDRSLGEEVAQERLGALVTTWRTAGPPRNPGAFVFAIAKRRARRTLFRRRLLLPVDRLLNHRQHGPDPEQAAIEMDRRARLLSAIRQLPRAEREAVLLVIGDGQKIHEAAAMSGLSVSAMKMRLSRAQQDAEAAVQELQQQINADFDRALTRSWNRSPATRASTFCSGLIPARLRGRTLRSTSRATSSSGSTPHRLQQRRHRQSHPSGRHQSRGYALANESRR